MSTADASLSSSAIGSRRGRNPWVGIAAIALAHFMIVIDMTIVNVALPSIERALAIGDAQRHWVVTAYTIAFGGLLLLGGRVADYTGRRRAFLIGLTGFAVASLLGGLSPTFEMLLVARVLQGASGALLAPAALSMLATSFTEPAQRAKAFGVFGAVVSLGSPLGLVLGGVLTTFLSWNWIFLVNLPIAVLTAVAAWRHLEGGAGVEQRDSYDVLGAVLATGGLVAVVYGFTMSSTHGWGAALTLVPITLGVALVAVFFVTESRAANPLLPLSVIRSRTRGGAYLLIILMMTGPFGAYLLVSFYLQGVQGFTPLLTGVAFLPLSVGVICSSTFVGRIMTKVNLRAVLPVGLLLAAAGMALLVRLRVDGSYATDVLGPLLMIGLGMGLVVPPCLNLSMSGVSPRDAGAAGAMFNVSQQVGASLGTALMNTVSVGAALSVAAGPGALTPAEQVHGYGIATLTGGGVLLAASVVAFVMINIRLGAPGDTN